MYSPSHFRCGHVYHALGRIEDRIRMRPVIETFVALRYISGETFDMGWFELVDSVDKYRLSVGELDLKGMRTRRPDGTVLMIYHAFNHIREYPPIDTTYRPRSTTDHQVSMNTITNPCAEVFLEKDNNEILLLI